MAFYSLYCNVDYPTLNGVAPNGSKLDKVFLANMDNYTVPDGLELRANDNQPIWNALQLTTKSGVPASVTNFQARAIMMTYASPTGVASRTLFQDVDDYINARGGVAQTAWSFARTVERRGELVTTLANNLGLTDQQIDDLFIAASYIQA